MTIDGYDSRGTVDGFVSVCNPNNGFLRNSVVPNSDIAVVRVSRTEKAESEGLSAGDQNVAVSDGMV